MPSASKLSPHFFSRLSAILFMLGSLFSVHLLAQPPEASTEDYVKAHYTKYEYRIPMRDGKKLFTAVYVPKDSAFPSEAGLHPILMSRTPYSVGPYGEDQYPSSLGPSSEFEKAAYIFVNQDVRGRWMSEGDWVEMRPHIDLKKGPSDVDESSDTYDTIDFLIKHVPGNNGKVGLWGISYPGFYTSAGIIDSHPALVAASPQAPVTDLFLGDDAYHGGAFMLAANFGFYTFFMPQKTPLLPKQTIAFDFGTPDTYRFYLNAGNLNNLNQQYLKGENWLYTDQTKHDTYDDYWHARSLAPHLKNVRCAVLVVGGWFDAEDLVGPHTTFQSISKNNPETPITLVEGPWIHGGWARTDGSRLGDVTFNAKTAEYFRSNVQFPFFEFYLKGKGVAQPKAVVFETGTNVWRKLESWPPRSAKAKTLYFHANGKLSFEAPSEASSSDSYLSDPAHPVPFVGYTTDGVPERYMVDDQRFAGYRPDVLVYQTETLTEDVTIAGPISPKLKITSTGSDSDFDVKLIDVYPENYPDPDESASHTTKHVVDAPPRHMGGYQQLLRGEPMRAKFRNSWEKPEALTPGKLTEVNFTMADVFHTFRAGHKIMIQVQSSWFPLTDRNPQTFTDIPGASPEQFVKATEQVFHQKDAASGVEVLMVPKS